MSLGTKVLVGWGNTRNGVDWYATPEREKVLKATYIEFFKQASQLKSCGDFCKHWRELCESFEPTLIDMLHKVTNMQDIVQKDNKPKPEKLVFWKFKGNCGEILVEALYNRGKFSKYNFHQYKPVEDREHEEFEDATVLDSDDITVGVQIKNHKDPIDLQTFVKAAAMWARNVCKIDPSDFEKYLTRPRQYIVSFSKPEKCMAMHTEYDKQVKFIGPDDINKMVRTEVNMESIFNEIIKELENE